MEKTILILAVALSGCYGNNEERTTQWLSQAKCPIVCRSPVLNIMTGARSYTMIDAQGVIFNSGMVIMSLPDTIRCVH